MNILVACEESQTVCKELRKRGHIAFSCDVLPCSGGHPEWHIKGDVTPLLNGCCKFAAEDGTHHEVADRWDMIIAFPPCTYLSNAGACRLYPVKGQLNMERFEQGLEAKAFFMEILNADCDRIAVENPVPSKVFELPPHTQQIQPWQFGHPVTKRTRLWLKGLPPLQPTNIVDPKAPFVPSGTGRKDRSKYGTAKRGDDRKNRSVTFQGIAQAMTDQWTKRGEQI